MRLDHYQVKRILFLTKIKSRYQWFFEKIATNNELENILQEIDIPEPGRDLPKFDGQLNELHRRDRAFSEFYIKFILSYALSLTSGNLSLRSFLEILPTAIRYAQGNKEKIFTFFQKSYMEARSWFIEDFPLDKDVLTQISSNSTTLNVPQNLDAKNISGKEFAIILTNFVKLNEYFFPALQAKENLKSKPRTIKARFAYKLNEVIRLADVAPDNPLIKVIRESNNFVASVLRDKEITRNLKNHTLIEIFLSQPDLLRYHFDKFDEIAKRLVKDSEFPALLEHLYDNGHKKIVEVILQKIAKPRFILPDYWRTIPIKNLVLICQNPDFREILQTNSRLGKAVDEFKLEIPKSNLSAYK